MSRAKPCLRRARASRRAFSLVELMVALAIGGVALSSMYAVGSATTRHFRSQQRISNLQTSVRMAIEQVKKDFQRAGYMGTPNDSIPNETCNPTPTLTVAAIMEHAEVNTMSPTGLVSDVTSAGSAETVFDSVVLTGNYATAGEYRITDNSSGSQLYIDRDWQSFRRDFSDWASTTSAPDPLRFKEAFRDGTQVRVHMQNEQMHFATVTSNSGDYSLTLSPQMTNTSCSLTGAWVSPLNHIRYRVDPADDAELGALGASAAEKPFIQVLRRAEVLPANHTTLFAAGEERSILDYVVQFRLRFRSVGSVANPTSWAPIEGGNASAFITATPQQVRSVIIDIAARAPEQETDVPDFGAVAPLRTLKVFTARPGAARVRAAHAEVFLPNVAYRKL